MNEDKPVGPGAVTGRAARQRHDRQAVIAYQAAAAGLLVALAAADFTGIRPVNNTSTWDDFTTSVAYCGVMLGIAYYLGRSRSAPGTGQRLNWPGRVISVVPIWALIQIPYFQGLDRLTKRRLCIRNIAITAGSVLVWSSWTELRSPVTGSVVAMAVLQVAGIALAVLMSLRVPAAGLQPAGRASPPGGDTIRSQHHSAAEMPDGSPAADEIIEVSPLATCARRLYWLAGSMKFGAFVFAWTVLAAAHLRPFSWGIAGAGALAALAVAMLMQEDWIRPTAGLALALGLISGICFVPALFGILALSGAWGAVIGWVIWPTFFWWLYLRQRRSSGLSDAEIQAASRVGHLPRRQGGPTARRVPPLRLWIRGFIGMICAIPLMIAGLVNSIFGVVVISGWIQAALDKLYAFARGSVEALLEGARSEEPIITALATPTEPGMWQMSVRGDLLRWGKVCLPPLLPINVPFGEFLRTRLEVCGEVRMIPETPRRREAEPIEHEASIVVMPLGVPYSPDVFNEAVALGTRMPLLLVVQSIGRRPLGQWPLLAWQMRDRGIALPPLDDPVRTIAVLHQATGKKIVFTAQNRNQWGYAAAIHEAFRAISSSGHPATRLANAPRAGSGQSLAHLRGWGPSEDAIERREKCAAPPTGNAVAAPEVPVSRAG